jgi:hypothetical protein
MSDVPPPIDVPPPPAADAGAATTGGEAAANPTVEATPDVSEAQFMEVNVPRSGAFGGIQDGEATLDPTANDTSDGGEAFFSEEFQRGMQIASDVASTMASALPVVMKGLLMDKVDPAGSLTGIRLEDAIQVNVLRDSAGAWIRGNAPEIAQKLDRVFGKNW